MFCNECLAYPTLCNKDSKFVKGGCTNFNIKSLQSHNKSEKYVGHDKAINTWFKMIQKMNEKKSQKMLETCFELLTHQLRKVVPLRIIHGRQTSAKLTTINYSVLPSDSDSEVSGNVNDSDNNIDLNRVDVGALFNSDSESDFDGFIFNVT